jgi:hypothetical protein
MKALQGSKIEVGTKVNLLMKPVLMREWIIVKETKKCYIVRKTWNNRYGMKNYLGDCHYIPKKDIAGIIEVS